MTEEIQGQDVLHMQKTYPRVENDWYVEPISATERLLRVERPFTGCVLDPCCGQCNIARAFIRQSSKTIRCHDIVKRKTGLAMISSQGSYTETIPKAKPVSIVTNPPYNLAQDIAQLALEHTEDRVCMFLKLTFLEGQKRYEWIEKSPLARVWIFPDRIACVPGHLINVDQKRFSGTTAYAWFVWERNYRGAPQIHWLSLEEDI